MKEQDATDILLHSPAVQEQMRQMAENSMDAQIAKMHPDFRKKMYALQTEMSVLGSRLSALDQDLKHQTAKLRETALVQQVAANKRKRVHLQSIFNSLVGTYNGLFDMVTDKDSTLTTSERWDAIFREMDEEAELLKPLAKKARGR